MLRFLSSNIPSSVHQTFQFPTQLLIVQVFPPLPSQQFSFRSVHNESIISKHMAEKFFVLLFLPLELQSVFLCVQLIFIILLHAHISKLIVAGPFPSSPRSSLQLVSIFFNLYKYP